MIFCNKKRSGSTCRLLAAQCGIILGLVCVPALAYETDCDELNRLYFERYIDDFSIDEDSFAVLMVPAGGFRCDGRDRNFIMARAINDLDRLRPLAGEAMPDYYATVSSALTADGNRLRYIPKLANRPDSTASTFVDGELASIFVTDAFIDSGERTRPTYTLVHEARHLPVRDSTGRVVLDDPGHMICRRGANQGRDVCDEGLTSRDDLARGSGNSHEFLFLLHLRDHPRASPVMRREASAQLSYLARNLFNRIDRAFLRIEKVE